MNIILRKITIKEWDIQVMDENLMNKLNTCFVV